MSGTLKLSALTLEMCIHLPCESRILRLGCQAESWAQWAWVPPFPAPQASSGWRCAALSLCPLWRCLMLAGRKVEKATLSAWWARFPLDFAQMEGKMDRKSTLVMEGGKEAIYPSSSALSRVPPAPPAQRGAGRGSSGAVMAPSHP